ncbi:MAG: CAP domain-containing protein [Anaerorhabdus sp.]
MKNLKILLSVCLLAQLFTISNHKFVQDVQAENIQKEITIQVNNKEHFKIIKQRAISDYINENEISIDDIDIENSVMHVDALDVSSVSSRYINLLIDLKRNENQKVVAHQTISVSYLLNVVDTIKPELEMKYDTLQVEKNSVFNPMDAILNISDNSQVDLMDQVVVNGIVDTSQISNSTITFSVQDGSGNTIEKSVYVQVKDYKNYAGAFSKSDEIDEMLKLINNKRAQFNLSPLELADDNGQIAAAIRAQEARGNISHTRPDGSHYHSSLEEQGVSWNNYPLEILTYGNSTISKSLNWWLNSPMHRAIVLKDGYDTIAIGKSGTMWAAIVY